MKKIFYLILLFPLMVFASDKREFVYNWEYTNDEQEVELILINLFL